MWRSVLLVTCTALFGCDDSTDWRLYRGSIVGGVDKVHMATFDALEKGSYNEGNCKLTADLFQAQPGVTVPYWCEKAN